MLSLRPLHPLFGAAVSGVDLTMPLTEAEFAPIGAAFERYSLLVFHEQPFDNERQVAFSRHFGPLEPTKVSSLGAGTPVVTLTNVGAEGALVPANHRQVLIDRANQLWHSDSSFKPVPALASLLSGREVPAEGGETEFASMRAAYAALSAAMRARIEGRVAIHHYAHSRGQIDPAMLTPEELKTLPPVRQAMVRTHPLTAEKSLYVGSHAMAIEGMAEAEGRALIEELLAFATQPRFVYTHRWRRHDLVIWDNRSMLHRGRPYPYGQQRRTMVRTTVAGDGPTVAEPFAMQQLA